MHPVRRPSPPVAAVLVGLVVLALAAGCGDSLATRSSDGSSRATTTSAAPVASPFCEAVENSRRATEPVAALGIGGRLGDVGQVADDVRTANQQVTALAPQEIRADFERTTALVEQQLQLLEANGGDTLALARDPAVARARTDPEFTAANRRVSDYVRRTCSA